MKKAKLAVKFAVFRAKAQRRISELEIELLKAKNNLAVSTQRIKYLSDQIRDHDDKLDKLLQILIKAKICAVEPKSDPKCHG
ncbi:hypothetical protein [Campylobacter sp. FOBRC14]|jgi:hypothetical protein|uniref:hypothetical protein n=1 Tax=Campylobacter sp. FOBRC14 TaxID=936554 RepID=UPI00027A385F|nr:hypothetical protein [Campylobacter sp. FOBRC14]EJP74722.1 hypothetical protein HMPREF1139_2320 [Campylobacter sp. FOBRC14]